MTIGAAKMRLEEAQKAARVRTIEENDIDYMLEQVEEKLGKIMYKKDWTGVEVIADKNGQSFPSSYKGVPESTIIIYTRKKTTWGVDIQRGVCRSKKFEVRMKESHAEAMKQFMESGLNFSEKL